jgi:hypothetical protein
MGNKLEKQSFGSINSVENPRQGYYYNKSKLFYGGKEISLYPNESEFKKMKFGYFRTNARVFYNGEEICANPKTFNIINRNQVHDHNKELSKLNSVIGFDFVGTKKRFFHKGVVVHIE